MRRVGCIIFLLIFSLAVFGQTTEEEKLKVIQKELKASKQKLRKTKKEAQAVLGRLVVISKELKKTKRDLNRTERKITTNRRKINILTEELHGSKGKLRDKEEMLGRRIREVYKSSGNSYLNLLFASHSMSDFLNRLYYFGKIVEQDAGLIAVVKNELQQTKIKRESLQKHTEEIKGLVKIIAKKKEETQAKAKEKEKLYQALRARRAEWEKRVAELEKSSRELEVLIQKKMAERAKAGIAVQGSGVMVRPLQGRTTSGFGYRRHPLWGGREKHTGLDIAAPHGAPVAAADSGEVIFAAWWDGYGKAIVVDHGRGITTVYAHLSRIYRKVGEIVAKGQTVGLVGSTGYSTGPHLHFEVRKNGTPVNPKGFLPR